MKFEFLKTINSHANLYHERSAIRGLSQKFEDYCHNVAENESNKKHTSSPVSSTFLYTCMKNITVNY